jgi:hypothetical protein
MLIKIVIFASLHSAFTTVGSSILGLWFHRRDYSACNYFHVWVTYNGNRVDKQYTDQSTRMATEKKEDNIGSCLGIYLF